MRLLVLVFISFLTISGCNKTKKTIYRGNSYDFNHLYMASSVKGSVIRLDSVGYEASTLSAEIVPPIKNVKIAFGQRHIIISIEDSSSVSGKELRLLFTSHNNSCDVFSDNFGKVKIQKNGGGDYSVLFSDSEDNWYLLGKTKDNLSLDC